MNKLVWISYPHYLYKAQGIFVEQVNDEWTPSTILVSFITYVLP